MSDIRLAPVENARGRHEFLWKMLEERMAEPEVNISHQAMPTMVEHIHYVDNHPYRAWSLIELRGEWIGSVYLTQRNEIGIQIAKAHRGEGWGLLAVRRMMSIYEPLPGRAGERPRRFVANINPKNAASIAMFKSLGAELIQHTYQLPERGAANGQITEAAA